MVRFRWPCHVHLYAGPEGVGGPVVPGIYDACSDMLAFRRRLLGARRLLDADVEVLVGPARLGVSAPVH